MLLATGAQVPDVRFASPWNTDVSLHEAIDGAPAVLFFLRYMGCPICQLTISEIRRDLARFSALDARVFVVLQSTPDIVRSLVPADAGFTIMCDPNQTLFRRFGVEPGNLFHYLAPSVIRKAMRAKRAGFGHGVKEGREMQRPAVFVVDAAKTVVFAHLGRTIGDVPHNDVLIGQLEALRAVRR